jgi:hypothetical protein
MELQYALHRGGNLRAFHEGEIQTLTSSNMWYFASDKDDIPMVLAWQLMMGIGFDLQDASQIRIGQEPYTLYVKVVE